MDTQDRIFMSRQEVLAAIRADFHQYAPQTHLFLELFPLVFGERAVISGSPRDNHLWMAERGGKMYKISPEDLGNRLCQELEQTRPTLEVLAAICCRIFRTDARPAESEQSHEHGISLSTGMDGFTCRQCGHCCRELDYYDQLTEADVNRWQGLGRNDILSKVRCVNQVGGKMAYRIWNRPEAGKPGQACPWLHKIPTLNRWECRIHDVRPAICRQYPGSHKHAEMTGCPGFNIS